MYLYNLSLDSSMTGINNVCVGCFTGTKSQEVVITKRNSTIIQMYDGQMNLLLNWNVFGEIRNLKPFRLVNTAKDYLVITSDSGRLVILEYLVEKNTWIKVHQETYGKSGVRRTVPGQYLSTDPKGRAILISAIEKQKFVYVMNRDANANLTISSPLESSKNGVVTFDIVGIDVGFENPLFAAIEVDLNDDSKEKVLTYYELDLGLNHVIRKSSESIPSSAHKLISVPGGNDGPSGVLICCENFVVYRSSTEGHGKDGENGSSSDIILPIPRREGSDPNCGILISTFYVHRMKSKFFIFVQTELGDVFKLMIDWEKVSTEKVYGIVKALRIKYFDTLPIAKEFCIFRAGYLFLAAESGNHAFYQIESLGDDSDTPEYSSANHSQSDNSTIYPFKPQTLSNLSLQSEMETLHPLLDSKVATKDGEDSPFIYTISGRGTRGEFKVLKRGLEATEMVEYPFPGNPIAVWSVKSKKSDEYVSYFIISFLNATIVLSIGDTVEEVTDTAFLGTVSTINVQQFGEDGLLQIHSQGMRHIRSGRLNEWRPPKSTSIVQSAVNNQQVVLALSNGEVIYFELDEMRQLVENEEKREMSVAIVCLALAPIEEGRVKSKFLAIGCADQTVRMVSLDDTSMLEALSMQALNSIPTSVLIAQMVDTGSDHHLSTLFLCIGLSNGVFLRTTLDSVTAQISDTRTRYLGPRPVRLFPYTIPSTLPGETEELVDNAVLALSTRPWLMYTHQRQIILSPIEYEMLNFASYFKTESIPEGGLVAITSNTLRIANIELGTGKGIGNGWRVSSKIQLLYTPRKLLIDAERKLALIIESDHRATRFSEEIVQLFIDKKDENGMDLEEDEEAEERKNELRKNVEQMGLNQAPAGNWVSCLRLIDLEKMKTIAIHHFENNSSAHSITRMIFHEQPTTQYYIVGTGKDVLLSPNKCTQGGLHIFAISNTNELQLVHETETDERPLCLAPFQGRLLAGVGKALRIYDLGKKKLLRKCELLLPYLVVDLQTMGDRVVISDVQESIHMAKYSYDDNKFLIFIDDTVPRWMTSALYIDYNTVACADKFGNFVVCRMPKQLSDDLEKDTTGDRLAYEKSYLLGAPHKFEHICKYHVGDMITSMHKTVLVPGGRDVILYTTLSGSIELFVPFPTREDIDLFQTMEMHMRQECQPLCGRDHLHYRSAYFPVKDCLDGVLIEMFHLADDSIKRKISDEFERAPSELARQMELARTRIS